MALIDIVNWLTTYNGFGDDPGLDQAEYCQALESEFKIKLDKNLGAITVGDSLQHILGKLRERQKQDPSIMIDEDAVWQRLREITAQKVDLPIDRIQKSTTATEIGF